MTVINIQNERVSFCGSNCGFVTIPRAETSVRPTGRPDDPTGRKSSQAPCSSLVCIERATNSLSLSRSLESFSEDLASTLRSIFMRAQVSSAWQWAAAERRAKKKKKKSRGHPEAVGEGGGQNGLDGRRRCGMPEEVWKPLWVGLFKVRLSGDSPVTRRRRRSGTQSGQSVFNRDAAIRENNTRGSATALRNVFFWGDSILMLWSKEAAANWLYRVGSRKPLVYK